MIYEDFFGLERPPFSLSPDPRSLYLTEQHREALAHLLYGVQGGGGFVLLTGEIGTGKTTVCRSLLEQLPGKVNVALLLNPKLSITELLQSICAEFGIPSRIFEGANRRRLVAIIYKYLLRLHSQGRSAVLIVDEAQNLSRDALEYLRLLTNLETSDKKLLQIILIGQPELKVVVNSPGLEQMAQRITARFHLRSLAKSEMPGYIGHRLNVAGAGQMLFDDAAVNEVWRFSGGTPRLINSICDRALLGAYVNKAPVVSKEIAQQAATEVLGTEEFSFLDQDDKWRYALFALLLLCAGFVLAYVVISFYTGIWQYSALVLPILGTKQPRRPHGTAPRDGVPRSGEG